MSPFGPVSVVFGLLLDLLRYEVLAPFSRALKASRGPHPVRIGWLVPLLGLVVVLDVSEECPDLDAWYLRQRRLVLGGMLGANVASWVGSFVLAC